MSKPKHLLTNLVAALIFLVMLLFHHLLPAQNVGIGTTNPQTLLDVGGYGTPDLPNAILSVTGNVNGNIGLQMKNTNSGIQAGMRLAVYDNIGTSSLNFSMPGTGNIQTALFGLPRSSNAFIFGTGTRGLGIGTYNASDLTLGTNNTANVTIKSYGDVGIGTTTPTERLDVNGQIRMRTGATSGYVPVSDANGVMTWTDPATITTAGDADWSFAGNDMYNANSGNIGVGTSTPVGDFTVSTPSGSTYSGIWSANHNSAQDPPTFGVIKSRGSESAPTMVRAGDYLFRLAMAGHNGTAYSSQKGFLEARTFYNWTSTNESYFLTFATQDIGTTGSPTERMRIAEDGDIGIGTTGPSEKLDVNGQIRMRTGATSGYIPVSDANGVMTWTDPGTITTGSDGDWTVTGNDLYNANSGNVGVGTTNPTAKLEVVVSNNSNVVNVMNLSANGYSAIDMRDNTGTGQLGIGYANTSTAWKPGTSYLNSNTAQLSLMTLNTSRLDITTAGEVGIGTTSPTERLDVVGQIRMRTGATSGYVPVSDANGVMTWTDPATLVALGSDGDWNVTGNDMYNANSGNIGIGTTSPVAQLDVSGEAYFGVANSGGFYNPNAIVHVAKTSNPHLLLEDISDNTGGLALNGSDGLYVSTENGSIKFQTGITYNGSFSGTGSTRMTIEDGGDVGIGTTNPEVRFHTYQTGLNELRIEGSTTAQLHLKDNDDQDSYWLHNNSGQLYFLWNGGTGGTGWNGDRPLRIIGANVDMGGNLNVQGTLSKGGGSFKIDNPANPENELLYHSFVESPDMMNVYNGNVVTDSSGVAVVELPDYFEALNKEFRYQLTTIGGPAQVWVSEEISGNSFVIQTNNPGVKVSWQVTGIRQDAWANENRIPNVVEKEEEDKGKYLHPEAFGQPKEMGMRTLESLKEKQDKGL